MKKSLPDTSPRPGDTAVLLIEHEYFGLDDENQMKEFTCRVKPWQSVEIASRPGVIKNSRGERIPVIAIKALDTQGVEREFAVELKLLLCPANDN